MNGHHRVDGGGPHRRLAGQVMRGGGYGLIGDIVPGIVGASAGGLLTGLLLGRDRVNAFNPERISVAFIGAMRVIAIRRAPPDYAITGDAAPAPWSDAGD
jgi:uncharacterized membrane protein YeaQ/YmgE (transglycosylase-associated protein family)